MPIPFGKLRGKIYCRNCLFSMWGSLYRAIERPIFFAFTCHFNTPINTVHAYSISIDRRDLKRGLATICYLAGGEGKVF